MKKIILSNSSEGSEFHILQKKYLFLSDLPEQRDEICLKNELT